MSLEGKPMGAADAFAALSAVTPGAGFFVSKYRGQAVYDPLLDAYVKDLPPSLMKLKKLLVARDDEASRFLCHQLRGSLATYGFTELAAVMNVLERWLEEARREGLADGAQGAKVAGLVQDLAVRAAYEAAACRSRARGPDGGEWVMGV